MCRLTARTSLFLLMIWAALPFMAALLSPAAGRAANIPPRCVAADEQKKIDFLISAIEASGATFLRNGSEYEAERAARHVRFKLGHAGGAVRTARQFIGHIASRSYMTGRPYYIVTKDGSREPTRQWLMRSLLRYEETGRAVALSSPASPATP